MTKETLPQMRRRHVDEVYALIQEQADARVTQAVAAERLGTTRSNICMLVHRLGIFWPSKKSGGKSA